MDELKAKLWFAAAGLFGGFIGQYTDKQPLTVQQRVGFIISGVATALFLIPWIASYVGLSTGEAVSGMSFIAGIYWKTIIMKAGELIELVKFPWGKKDA